MRLLAKGMIKINSQIDIYHRNLAEIDLALKCLGSGIKPARIF
jgi:hypothetical protein